MKQILQFVAYKLNWVFILRIYVKLSALRLSVCVPHDMKTGDEVNLHLY